MNQKLKTLMVALCLLVGRNGFTEPVIDTNLLVSVSPELTSYLLNNERMALDSKGNWIDRLKFQNRVETRSGGYRPWHFDYWSKFDNNAFTLTYKGKQFESEEFAEHDFYNLDKVMTEFTYTYSVDRNGWDGFEIFLCIYDPTNLNNQSCFDVSEKRSLTVPLTTPISNNYRFKFITVVDRNSPQERIFNGPKYISAHIAVNTKRF